MEFSLEIPGETDYRLVITGVVFFFAKNYKSYPIFRDKFIFLTFFTGSYDLLNSFLKFPISF